MEHQRSESGVDIGGVRVRGVEGHLSCWMRSSPSLMTLTVTCRVVCCCWPNLLMRSWTASTDSAYTSSRSSFCSSSSHVHSWGAQGGGGRVKRADYCPVFRQRKGGLRTPLASSARVGRAPPKYCHLLPRRRRPRGL